MRACVRVCVCVRVRVCVCARARTRRGRTKSDPSLIHDIHVLPYSLFLTQSNVSETLSPLTTLTLSLSSR